MDKNETVEILKELPERIAAVIMPSDRFFDYKGALDFAIKTLEADRWISVKDAIPNKEGWYEATFISVTGARHVSLAFYSDRLEDFAVDGVIAWRPLPEPYESEGVK